MNLKFKQIIFVLFILIFTQPWWAQNDGKNQKIIPTTSDSTLKNKNTQEIKNIPTILNDLKQVQAYIDEVEELYTQLLYNRIMNKVFDFYQIYNKLTQAKKNLSKVIKIIYNSTMERASSTENSLSTKYKLGVSIVSPKLTKAARKNVALTLVVES